MVVRWHWLAERQLKEVFDYYRNVAGENTAIKVALKIRQHSATLGAMPLMGAVEPSVDGVSEQYRALVIARRYKAIYYVDEENETVVVVDIWDCRQDPETLRDRVAEMQEI